MGNGLLQREKRVSTVIDVVGGVLLTWGSLHYALLVFILVVAG